MAAPQWLGSVSQNTENNSSASAPAPSSPQWLGSTNAPVSSAASDLSPIAKFILGGMGAPGVAARVDPTFAKAAISAMPDMLSNFSEKLDTGVNALNKLIYPSTLNVPQLKSPTNFVPSALQVTPSEAQQNPISNIMGSLLGGTPLALATGGVADELPLISGLKELGAGSKLAQGTYLTAQGELQNAMYNKPGDTEAGAIAAPILGYGLGSIAIPAIKSVPGIMKFGKNLFNPSILKNLGQDAQNAENLINHRIENITAIPQNALNSANEVQAQQLGVGQDFKSRLGTGIKNAFLNIRNSFKPAYQSIRNRISGMNVTNPRAQISSDLEDGPNSGMTPGSPDISTDLNLLLPSSDTNEIQSALTSLKSNSTQIPAQHALDLWKALSSAARSARSKAQSALGDFNSQLIWHTKANNLQSMANSYDSVMKNELPSDVMSDLQKTNDSYREQVIPFYEHGSFKRIMDEGKVPQNFMDVTSGTEPHQQIMQKLIQSNPELTRLAIGQKYAANPQNLLQWDEVSEPYINAHQPTQNLLQTQQAAQNNLEQANYMKATLQAQDKYQQAGIVSHLLDQDHQDEMNDIMSQKMAADQKLKAATDEITNYQNKKRILGRFAGAGALAYVAHRMGFDFLENML